MTIDSDLVLLGYFVIPLTAALIGYYTNKLAIHMTFYPLEFKGWGGIGWQGIIPSRAERMAGTIIDQMTDKLLDIDEMVARVDADDIVKVMKPRLEPMAERAVDRAMRRHMPFAWPLVPKQTKQAIYKRAAMRAPLMVELMLDQVKTEVHDLFDIRSMVVEHLTKDKDLLNRLFQKVGEKEFQFVARSGFYFGFLFGIIQMLVWYNFPFWWILPLGGLLVGYVTNWLALKLIFRPLKPLNLGIVTFQGLFIKRQPQVADAYGKLVANEILTMNNIAAYVMQGSSADHLIEQLQEQLTEEIDKAAGLNKPLLTLASSKEKYEKIRADIAEEFMRILPKELKAIEAPLHKKIALEDELRTKMKAMTSLEFEGTLRPVFQQDEWILIVVGGILGAGAGCLQLLMLL